jgi:putative Mg2+ transporter-C (MgtC) family protein
VNVAPRALGRVVDRRPDTGDEVPAQYLFEAVTRDDAEAHVHALLVQALTRTDFRLLSVLSTDLPGIRRQPSQPGAVGHQCSLRGPGVT